MMSKRGLHWLILMVLTQNIVSIEVHEPQIDDVTTEQPFGELTTHPEFTQLTDNGMAVASLPEQVTASSLLSTFSHHDPSLESEEIHEELHKQEDEEELKHTEHHNHLEDEEQLKHIAHHNHLEDEVSLAFKIPDNHKNFTSSEYLGTIETPPLLQVFNKYQKPYKEYYEQKAMYNQKPIRFEDGSHQNRLVTPGLGTYDDEKVQVQYRHKPFPYQYENIKNPLKGFEATATEGTQDHLELLKNGEHKLNQLFPQELQGLFGHHQEANDVKFSHGGLGFSEGFGFGGGRLHGSAEHHLRPAEHKENHQVDHKSGHNPWKKVLRMLTALVPLGFFIASLTPSVLLINSTTEQKPSRQRSLDDVDVQSEDWQDPLVRLVDYYGLESLEDPVCEDRLFCEMSRMGSNETSNFVQQGFWYLANETPDDLAQQAGMKELFAAIRSGTCDVYHCEPKKKETKENIKVEEKSQETSRSSRKLGLHDKHIKLEKKRKIIKRKKFS